MTAKSYDAAHSVLYMAAFGLEFEMLFRTADVPADIIYDVWRFQNRRLPRCNK